MSNPELTRKPSALDRQARRLARAATPGGRYRPSASMSLSRGLGWFSIGLGVAELLATRWLADATGLRGRESVLRLNGLREVGVGLGLLASSSPAASSGLMWGRVAGDMIDLATLGSAAASPRPRGGHPMVAAVAVVGVTALDIVCARSLAVQADGARQTTDYSDRVGLQGPPDEMRGAALDTFEQPGDMRVSPRPAEARASTNEATLQEAFR